QVAVQVEVVFRLRIEARLGQQLVVDLQSDDVRRRGAVLPHLAVFGGPCLVPPPPVPPPGGKNTGGNPPPRPLRPHTRPSRPAPTAADEPRGRRTAGQPDRWCI